MSVPQNFRAGPATATGYETNPAPRSLKGAPDNRPEAISMLPAKAQRRYPCTYSNAGRETAHSRPAPLVIPAEGNRT
jgi:hypothetical protein